MKLTNKKSEKLGEVIFAFTDDFGSTPLTQSVGGSGSAGGCGGSGGCGGGGGCSGGSGGSGGCGGNAATQSDRR
jgi:hypothetical protein